jgi:DNA-directed RNA polymerase III subunit RPC8
MVATNHWDNLPYYSQHRAIMFILTTVVDTIRIPPSKLSVPTLAAVQSEIDRRYPNRVLMDVGLVICRYGDCLKIGDGVCVNCDGGAHHECLVKLVIFRPFVEEVCVGKIIKSTADGIQVSLGFFQDIFIPPYWMLRPSRYETRTGLWVWTPTYDDHDNSEDGDKNKDAVVKEEVEDGVDPGSAENASQMADANNVEDNRYEMEIGAQIRFKVKSINFTQVTSTAKGLQATTTTTAQAQASIHPNMMGGTGSSVSDGTSGASGESSESHPVRKRSLSVDLTESQNVPATMHVVASICEDGLGLTSWWTSPGEEDDEGEEEELEK